MRRDRAFSPDSFVGLVKIIIVTRVSCYNINESGAVVVAAAEITAINTIARTSAIAATRAAITGGALNSGERVN